MEFDLKKTEAVFRKYADKDLVQTKKLRTEPVIQPTWSAISEFTLRLNSGVLCLKNSIQRKAGLSIREPL